MAAGARGAGALGFARGRLGCLFSGFGFGADSKRRPVYTKEKSPRLRGFRERGGASGRGRRGAQAEGATPRRCATGNAERSSTRSAFLGRRLLGGRFGRALRAGFAFGLGGSGATPPRRTPPRRGPRRFHRLLGHGEVAVVVLGGVVRVELVGFLRGSRAAAAGPRRDGRRRREVVVVAVRSDEAVRFLVLLIGPRGLLRLRLRLGLGRGFRGRFGLRRSFGRRRRLRDWFRLRGLRGSTGESTRGYNVNSRAGRYRLLRSRSLLLLLRAPVVLRGRPSGAVSLERDCTPGRTSESSS